MASANAVEWLPATSLHLEGRGFSPGQLATPFDRLPAHAEGVVRAPVWELSLHSAGICVCFRTDAKNIHARWSLRNPSLAMTHMPASGVSGVDLYVLTQQHGWRFVKCGMPTQQDDNTQELWRAADDAVPTIVRDFTLYLPLYNGISSLEIGIDQGSGSLLSAIPRPIASSRSVVFYGTSITHGGCASRPGMAYPAIVGRRLGIPTINLGFSGNGRMEPEVAALLAEIEDPACFVIDCVPNMNDESVAENGPGLVSTLRMSHATVPIVLVEDRIYAYNHSGLFPESVAQQRKNRAALRKVYDNAAAAADQGGLLHLVEAEAQLGDDGEDTVDGSHPTDLGFMRQADALVSILGPILRGARQSNL
jgi:hypothetical protein